MKRVNIKDILANPRKRRSLMASTLRAIQAREGRDMAWSEAYAVVDRIYKEKE